MAENLATLLANRPTVGNHRPWPRVAVDETSWIAIGRQLAAGGGELISLWGDADAAHMAVRGDGLPDDSPVRPTLILRELSELRPRRE